MKKILFVALLLLIGCQKQKPSQISPDYVDSLSDVRRAEACKKTNLLDDILLHDNVVNLFQCTTWDKEFPELFKVTAEMPGHSWDFFMEPVNKEVFNNRELRDKLVAVLKELDQKNGLDDLGRVITSLSDSNFFGHVSDVITCANNEECSKEKNITPDDIWNFFTFFKMEEGEVLDFARLLSSFSYSLENGGADFKTTLGAELEKEAFLKARSEFFNQMFKKMGDKDFDEEIRFYLSMIEGETSIGWLPKTIRTKLSKSSFSYLVRYPTDVHTSLWKDFKVLDKTLDITLGCSGLNPIDVDVTTHLKGFLDSLFNGSQGKFFRNSLQSVTILKTAQEICPNLTSYESEIRSYRNDASFSHKVNFAEILEKTTQLMLNKDYYEFVKNLHYSGVGANNDPEFLIRYLSTDLFSSFIEMVRTIGKQNPNLVGGTYDLLKAYPDEGYTAMAKALNWVKDKPHSQKESVAKVWTALGDDGKLFFFNFLDSHYTNKTNLSLLFDFYNALVNILEPQINTLLDLYLSNSSREFFIPSLADVSLFLGKRELLEDYRKFFSRDHLLEILRIVSSRSINAVSGSLISQYQLVTEGALTPIENTPRIIATTVEKCLSRLNEPNRDFYSLLNALPSDCLPLAEEDPYFRFMAEAGKMGKAVMGPIGFDGTGFFSSQLMGLATNSLNRISKVYSDENGEGLANKLDGLSEWLAVGKRKSVAGDALSLASKLGKEDVDLIGTLADFYALNGEFEHFSKVVEFINLMLLEHGGYKRGVFNSQLEPTSFEAKEKFLCANYHQSVGGRPCPSNKELKAVANRIIKLVLNKNDENPTALEQFLRMVTVGYGLPIPYQSEKQTYKRVTLKESFSMFFNFTDSSLATNNTKIEYSPIPKADEEYFNTEDWEVDKRHLKGAPDESVVNMNTMERIEVVIRDVRFDENYLGAHYLNAVSKAESYNDTVEAKYKVLKTCVPLKFCGKFMDKAQHKYAKNSRDTFLSLLDVNTKEGWEYGPYMQALLTSLVSSSPDKSQVSSLIKKKILGLNIEVPLINSKKVLRKHNGKILGLVSMVGMFTNSARVLRDRVSENREEFEAFLENPKLKQIDDNLMRNFDVALHLPELENLLEGIVENGLLDKVLDYVADLDYTEQRLFENIVFKALYTFSYIGDPNFLNGLPVKDRDRYKDLSLLDLLGVVNAVVDNHNAISAVLKIDKDFLVSTNHFFDVINTILDRKDLSSQTLATGLNEIFYFLKINQGRAAKQFASLTSSEEKLNEVYLSLLEGKTLLNEISASSSNEKLVHFVNVLRHDKLNWTPMQDYLQLNATRAFCSNEMDRDCRVNTKHRQFQKILDYLFSDRSSRMLNVLEYYSGKENVKIKEFFNKVFPSIVN